MQTSSLRGVLFEEALALLMRANGLDLIDAPGIDENLEAKNGQMFVRGRGSTHQADALADFAFIPSFSMPLRLIVEAKSYEKKVGLATARGLKGLVDDLNEMPNTGNDPLATRHRYVAALASESGFSPYAVEFAVAHQLSPIDLSYPVFKPVRSAVRQAARETLQASRRLVGPFPVQQLRVRFRSIALETSRPDEDRFAEAGVAGPVDGVLTTLVTALKKFGSGIAIGFGRGPYVLPLLVDTSKLVKIFQSHNVVNVGFRYKPGKGRNDPPGYQIVVRGEPTIPDVLVVMPPQVMRWIAAADDNVLKTEKVYATKKSLLSHINVYLRDEEEGIVAGTFRYEPVATQEMAAKLPGAD